VDSSYTFKKSQVVMNPSLSIHSCKASMTMSS